ncbi:serine/arginine repetitive matrix protein 1-like [Corythoichthys intestinalis]|uniref:serine/arginine repetitive matrix protein 1-like n=1 Tax=Corythoichthys intestinalis TaxID=161448 RepID=UPI0025A4CEE7|nr:serine/arginine repetitive matrix protein 1-like [Corythoichthys intestinalis]
MDSVPSLQNLSEAEIEELLHKLYKDLALANVLPKEVVHKTRRSRKNRKKSDDQIKCGVSSSPDAWSNTETDVASAGWASCEEDNLRKDMVNPYVNPYELPPILVTASMEDASWTNVDVNPEHLPEVLVLQPSLQAQALDLPPSPLKENLFLTPSPTRQEPFLTPSPQRQEAVFTPSPPREEPVFTPSPPSQELVFTPSPPRQEPVFMPSPPRQEPVFTPSPPRQEPVFTPSPPRRREPVFTPSPTRQQSVFTPSPPRKSVLTPSPSRQRLDFSPSPPRKIKFVNKSEVMVHMKGSDETSSRTRNDTTPSIEKAKCVSRVTILGADKAKTVSFVPPKKLPDTKSKHGEPRNTRPSYFIAGRQGPSKSEPVIRPPLEARKTRLGTSQTSAKKSERSQSLNRLTILESTSVVTQVRMCPKRTKLGSTGSLPEVRRTRLSLRHLYGAERPKTDGADARLKPKQPWKNPLSDPPKREGPPRVLWMDRERVKPVQNRTSWKIPANILF